MHESGPDGHGSFHESAAILSIGDELTLGQKLDTNSQWLAEQLVARGVVVREHATLADDLEQNVRTLARLAAEYPLLVVTGGLGPTLDDLTREALARVLGEALVEDERGLAHVRSIMERRGRVMTDNQRLQALRPASAVMIDNPNGTAPGIAARVARGGEVGGARGACDVFCLPGPPGEMKPMFEAFVVPRLRTRPGREVRTRVLHCLGIGEGDLATRLGELMQRGRNPLVGTTASGGVVSIRVRYEGDAGGAGAVMEETERLCRERAGAFVFGAEEERIESVVVGLLRERGRKLVLVESCTGGMVGSLLTSVAGSSDVLLGGYVTYANEMKTALVGVPQELIEAHGAVSEPVALAMARGGLERTSGATDALAITGVAGPGGGSVAKPVGTVFVARASRAGGGEVSSECRRLLITGGREDVRGRASRLALAMLRWHVLGETVPTVLWQVRGA